MKIRSLTAVALMIGAPLATTACFPDPPPVDPWVAAAGCYTYYGIDLYFTGEKNTFGNAGYRVSGDGSCSGALEDGIYGTNTIVDASSYAAATALCDSLDAGPTEYSAYDFDEALVPDFPVANAWSCIG